MKILSLQPEAGESAVSAIEPIRVEMLSTEMPVHQLAKRGGDEIRIIRRGPNGGQVNLYWKVEPNMGSGRPGQLAYHLDTWVIKRRLYELPRPIPRLIRIGDLREIARDLDHGGDTNAVKRAFEQNASAFIRAKLAYRTRDGREETFEGYFNRYNVFYRGQSLPGGTPAETVYISLNDPYYTLINASTWRPLDYRYLRSLTPAAQRFYELVSPKVFAAIKNRHPSAWIRYSDFCLLAVQRRQQTRRRMQIQMAAVHRPHLRAAYLADVDYRPERAEDGLLDWTIHYVPGSRAFAEFDAFNGSRRPRRTWDQRPLRARTRPPVRGGGWSRSGALSPSPRCGERLPANASPRSTVQRLVSAVQLAESQDRAQGKLLLARSLASRFFERRYGATPAEVTETQLQRALTILDACAGDYDLAIVAVDMAAKSGVTDKAGFPSHLGGVLEGGFLERVRAVQNEAARRRDASERLAREQARRDRYEAWCRERAADRIGRLSSEERRRLVDEGLPAFFHDFRHYFRLRSWSDERTREWAEPRILERYGREDEPTFEEWCRLHDSEANGSSGPGEALQ